MARVLPACHLGCARRSSPSLHLSSSSALANWISRRYPYIPARLHHPSCNLFPSHSFSHPTAPFTQSIHTTIPIRARDYISTAAAAVMAMATGVAELATAFSAVVPNRGAATFQPAGQALKMQAPVCKRHPGAVVAVSASQRQWADEEEGGKRSTLLSTAMALAGVALVATSVAGSAEAAIQKVEGTEREEQDAVTTGIREPPNLGSGKGNTVKEGGKTNTQASGGLILGAPKLEEPAGAYRSPQSSTYKVGDVGSKRSTPAGVLQGSSEGKSGSGDAKIGGSAMADE